MVGLLDGTGAEEPRRSNIEPVDPKTFTGMMEQLQEGYIASVAATVGCTIQTITKDYSGTDLHLIRPPRTALEEETMVYAQLKSTTTIYPDAGKDFFSYQFTKRQYFDHMVKPRKLIKAILIVMTMSPRQADWTTADHEGLLTRRSCYWACLEGVEAPSHVQKPTVRIPTKNLLDARSLSSILDRIERGESLHE
ncbi:DUF4365 domain-containing protein [Streptomyces nanshensis]|uniref:DUF4365 domain-containing protein n=1 Tax=Streptomyces nanshensis TaxID=518642 RepID=A0A1E7L4H8_9ACTN|nr:DUF4365 domain-containing protein [Streptomyces nanshensis]OEV11097.1 hypothetical protein AN218_14545 [Streptomyces nanshensis]